MYSAHLNILGLETSCDDTSAAIVANGREIRANIISSQIQVHQKFGGVVPEIASRKHLENISVVIDEALRVSGLDWPDIGGIAVTYGPGLVGALLVGVSTGKALAYARNIPLIGVNHLEAHIYANFLEHPELCLPVVCLVVSGGHTNLIYLQEHGRYELLGRTRDDAAGEAFDKIARTMGLGYPGGPQIDRLAQTGDPTAIPLPRAWLEEGSLDFSFSGLKSAVLNYLNRANQLGSRVNYSDLAASFQQAVIDVLVYKTIHASKQKEVKTILLAGGVAANSWLRRQLAEAAAEAGMNLVYPSSLLCTDNAAMVACAGYYKFCRGDLAPLDLNAVPNLSLI
ncbi:MAG: tRNA (adenosine(37)-N6)-threonylcarbamoyltransferase complex transferase subunit TsaD [Firmicutes bacterium]|nr:tRNA (adenosine(37)-N6)-threonylcarbamoyltransferase complex transferase subunit TsaD [Bacillota bacterium]